MTDKFVGHGRTYVQTFASSQLTASTIPAFTTHSLSHSACVTVHSAAYMHFPPIRPDSEDDGEDVCKSIRTTWPNSSILPTSQSAARPSVSTWVMNRRRKLYAKCCWSLIYHRCRNIKFAYLYDGEEPYLWKPIPVSPDLQLGHLQTTPYSRSMLTTRMLQGCLHYIDDIYQGRWFDKSGIPGDADTTLMTPGLFVRADVEESQHASVSELFSGNAVSAQLAHEMKPERLIGLFVTNILGKNSDCWVSVPLRSVWEDTASTRPALVAIVAGNSATDKHDRYVARAQMAQILHKTLIMLVKHHYHSQGWAYDRKLSDADADVMMDARLFAYGIFHSNTEFTVCSNFPRPEKQVDGEWQWIFDNTEWMTREIEIPLQHYHRTALFNAMLAVEQHMYELNQVLCFV